MVIDRRAPIASAPLVLRDVPVPEPGPRELRVRVRACGLCRTDLHVIEGELPPVTSPLIPGHQVVGTAHALGAGATRFALGARVGIAWLRQVCGRCPDCLAGRENLCASPRFTGYHDHGGYAEYALVHEDFAYAIPDAFSDAEATPLLCAGIIGYRALVRSGVPDGGRLGLHGFGASAHIVLQLARARGCHVFVSTRGARHRELASRMGATWVGDADEAPPVKLDAAILFAPAGELVPPALRALRRGGRLACAGIYMSDIPAMSYEPHLFYERELVSVTANTRADGQALLAEAAAIPLRPQVTCLPLERANEALQRLAGDGFEGAGVLTLG
jgi:propanol-preferring alcohol dehydrogenase